jgi:hypothetical protein
MGMASLIKEMLGKIALAKQFYAQVVIMLTISMKKFLTMLMDKFY